MTLHVRAVFENTEQLPLAQSDSDVTPLRGVSDKDMRKGEVNMGCLPVSQDSLNSLATAANKFLKSSKWLLYFQLVGALGARPLVNGSATAGL
jgi:hypothetical protein